MGMFSSIVKSLDASISTVPVETDNPHMPLRQAYPESLDAPDSDDYPPLAFLEARTISKDAWGLGIDEQLLDAQARVRVEVGLYTSYAAEHPSDAAAVSKRVLALKRVHNAMAELQDAGEAGELACIGSYWLTSSSGLMSAAYMFSPGTRNRAELVAAIVERYAPKSDSEAESNSY